MTLIRGAKGGKGGGGTPTEEDDTLQSVQYAAVLDLISEGEIQGLDTGDEKSIYLDGTPVLNELGVKNFQNYSTAFRSGTQAQTAIPQLKGTEVEVSVGADVGNTTGEEAQRISGSVIRTFTQTETDAVRVTIGLPRGIQLVEDDGDIRGNTVKLQIEVKYDSGNYATIFPNNDDGSVSTGREIKGKSSPIW